MEIDPAALPNTRRYRLLISAIVPRPIAFVSTRSRDGRDNLAPFSFFMGVGSDPPMIALSVSSRDGEKKDTARNLEETGEFIVHVATEELAHAVNEASGDWAFDDDEFVRTGLAKAAATKVDVARIRDAKVALECRTHTVLPLGKAPHDVRLVIGEVVWIHVDETVLEEAPAGLPTDAADAPLLVDATLLKPLARLGKNLYTTLGSLIALDRPRVPKR
jgi:flavin reductase (DIM6/NTAB) family NADH-FMN oxidoreductase RutF